MSPSLPSPSEHAARKTLGVGVPLRFLAIAVAAVIMAGCGDDGADTASGSLSLTETELTQQANTICNVAKPKIAAFFAKVTTRAQLHSRLGGFKSIMRDTSAQLAALEPPDELRTGFERFVDLQGDSIRVVIKLAEAQAANRPRRLDALITRLDEVNQEFNEQAHEIGLDACADSDEG